jgi:hypothetical protein
MPQVVASWMPMAEMGDNLIPMRCTAQHSRHAGLKNLVYYEVGL